MKKFALNAVAAAALGFAAIGAHATVDFTASPVAVTKLAKELNYSDAATTNKVVSGTNTTTVTVKMGFGVSATQNRHIRVDLANAKFAQTGATGGVTATGAGSATFSASWVGGGAVGDTYIIYQVTGGTGGHQASDTFTITLPGVYVTNANAAPVGVTYALYDTAPQAVAAASGTQLATTAGNLFTFATGLQFDVTTNNNVAIVADKYKKFTGSSVGPVEIGRVTYGADATVYDGHTNAAVALTALVGASSTLTFTGDFSATAAANGLYVTTTAACGVGGYTDLTAALNTAKTSATYTIGNTAATALQLCWTVTGTTVVPIQTIKGDLNPVAATGSSITDPAAVTWGTITHDGTTLEAPFFTINPNFVSRFVIDSTYSQDVAWTATVRTENGSTCAAGTLTGTIKANATTVIDATTICPSITGGAPRASVSFAIEANNQYINGAYNVSDKNAASSPASYVMVKN